MKVWGLFDESYGPGPCPLLSLHATEDSARAAMTLPEYAGMDLCVEELEVEGM